MVEPRRRPRIAGKPPITARDILRISRPPAAPTDTTPFKGRIESIGIGPVGIVAHVHSHLDWDAWVASKLGKNWVSHYTGVDYRNGVLRIGMDNGPGLRVNWADEGFLPGDYQDKGFGWFSPDGVEWTAIPQRSSRPQTVGQHSPRVGDVVGVSDGFIARGDNPEDTCPLPAGCSEMWHSSDGLTWRNLGAPARDPRRKRRVAMEGRRARHRRGRALRLVDLAGLRELPMAAEVRTATKAGSGCPHRVRHGTARLVRVSATAGEILVTRDGIDWSLQPMPADMSDDHTVDRAPGVAVGERSVLVMLWTGSYEEGYVPSLWRGSFEP